MNMLIALLMMISFSFAGTLEVSQKIAASYQKLINGAPTGTYSLTLLGTYDYMIAGEQATLPVLLMSPQAINVPSTMKGCEDANSLSCDVANYLATWILRVNPQGQGQFKLELSFYGKGILKESVVLVDKSELQ